jgi:hypothetical protein
LIAKICKTGCSDKTYITDTDDTNLFHNCSTSLLRK